MKLRATPFATRCLAALALVAALVGGGAWPAYADHYEYTVHDPLP